MKNAKIILLTLFAAWPLLAQATDTTLTVTLRQPIETLIIAGELDIVLTNDTTESIRIEDDRRAVNNIRVSTCGGKVKLRTS